MLKYNFDRLLKLRNIDRPFAFLVKAGFSENFATKIKNNRIKIISLDLLERICVNLSCTPNDLFEWSPSDEQSLESNHPLYQLKRRHDKISDLTKTLSSLPLNKLEEIEQLINEKK